MTDFVQQASQGRLPIARDCFPRQPCRCAEQHPIRQALPLRFRQGCQRQGDHSSHLTAPQQQRLAGRHQHTSGHRLKRITNGGQHSLGRRARGSCAC